MNRREWLTLTGIGTASLVAGCAMPGTQAPGASGAAKLPDFQDPAVNLESIVRVQGSLREEDVPWWFNGTIYGVVGESAPRALVRFEGLEIYWFRKLPDGAYQLGGNTVTFFRDIATNAMITEFVNPYTGKTNTVQPAVQGGRAGFHYSVRGIRPTAFKDRMPDVPLRLWWSSVRDAIWMHNETVYPPGMPPPRAQRQTMFNRLEDFLDPQQHNLPTLFSSTVFMPWLKWMEMEGQPGHVIWHASGAKIPTIEMLPAEFLERARREFPQRLSANPDTWPS